MTALQFGVLVGAVTFVVTAAVLFSKPVDRLFGKVMCAAGWHKWSDWGYLFDCRDVRYCERPGCFSNETQETDCDTCPEGCE